MLCGKLMKPRIQESLTMACGVCVIFLGIAGAMENMLSAAADGTLSSGGTMTLIASLVLGALIGEIINIEAAMERFGTWLRKISHSEGDGGFVGGFVNASLTVCVGAMAVVGSIQDGILGYHSTLFAKAVLDLIIVMVMTAASGKGCIFSAIPVAIFQGTITALSKLLEPVMTQHGIAALAGQRPVCILSAKIIDFICLVTGIYERQIYEERLAVRALKFQVHDVLNFG